MQDSRFQTLLHAPSPLVLIGNRSKLLGSVMVYAFILTFAIIFMLRGSSDNFLGAIAGFMIVMLAVSLLKLFNPSLQSLTLTDTEFMVTDFKRKTRRNWADYSDFKAEKNDVISFKYSTSAKDLYAQTAKAAKVNKALVGYDESFKNKYNLTSPQLAQLLNHWREKRVK